MKRWISLLVAVLLGVGGYFAVALVGWQHRANTVFVPVEALIEKVEIRRHSGKKTTYSPEIRYRYTYGGREYSSDQVLPYSQSASHAWASGIVERFGGERIPISIERAPRKATAYVNPEKPEEAVLVREYSFTPYLFALLALMGALIGGGIFAGVIGGGRSEMVAVPLDGEGTSLLLPKKALREGWWHSVVWLGGASALLLPLWAHWGVVAGQPWGVFLVVVLGVLGGLATVAIRRWTLTRNMSDARLKVKPAPLVRGQVFALEVEADVYRPLEITGVRAIVRCIEHYKEKRGNKTSYGTRTKGEQTAVMKVEVEQGSGGVGLLSGKGELFFGAGDLPPSTDLAVKTYPYYRWEVRVEVAIAKHADYGATFPLEVA